jgi:NAD(P)-dependent dehydrogenase (short-subunit alcohol dehydrogenase family)
MSYVRATRLVLPDMRKRGAGFIVNNASDLARQPEPVPTDYSVSKAAVLALTKGLARSEGPNIRVNAVAPGPIWTPFWSKPGGFADTMSAFHKMPPKEAVEHEMCRGNFPPEAPDSRRKSLTCRNPGSDLASFVTSSVWGERRSIRPHLRRRALAHGTPRARRIGGQGADKKPTISPSSWRPVLFLKGRE